MLEVAQHVDDISGLTFQHVDDRVGVEISVRPVRARSTNRSASLTVSLEELDRLLTEGQPAKAVGTPDPPDEPEHDLVLSASWSHRGTVEVAVMLRGGDRPVKRRGFSFLTGMALTTPAHQWLIHEPGPLVSGLSGRRVSAWLVDRLMA